MQLSEDLLIFRMVQGSLHSTFYLILRLKYLPAHLSSVDSLVLVFSPNLDFIFLFKVLG